jgi:hypothetical protein
MTRPVLLTHPMQYIVDSCPKNSAALVLTPFDLPVETLDHSNISDNFEEAKEKKKLLASQANKVSILKTAKHHCDLSTRVKQQCFDNPKINQLWF